MLSVRADMKEGEVSIHPKQGLPTPPVVKSLYTMQVIPLFSESATKGTITSYLSLRESYFGWCEVKPSVDG